MVLLIYCGIFVFAITVESANNVGFDSSIALDSSGNAHISHKEEDGANDDLRYCNNTAGSWSCTAVETANDIGWYSSIAIDSNDKIHISHFDDTNDDLRYCNNTAGSWNCTKLAGSDSNFLGYPNGRALAIKKGRIVDSTLFSGKVHISWYNNTDLMYTSVGYDTINPNINITYPINNTNWTTNTVDVNYTASDNLNELDSCWYSNDTYLKNTSLANCGTNITTII